MSTSPGFRYAVLGAGRQGLAVAYDLMCQPDTAAVVLADASEAAVEAGLARLAELRTADTESGADVSGSVVDALAAESVRALLEPVDVAVSAVPYDLNAHLARVAVAAKTSFCDLGGNTDVVLAELAMDSEARAAGVSIVPDCGLAPGFAQSLAAYALHIFEQSAGQRASWIRVYCGGLPRQPRGPLGYSLSFSLKGLINEYTGDAVVLRGGEVCKIPALSEVELVSTGIGELEAFVTSGGTSTAPMTFAGRLDSYSYKTLRYPGHVAIIRALDYLGLFDLVERELPGVGRAVPRQVFAAIAEPHLDHGRVDDIVILKVRCGSTAAPEVEIELIDRHDEVTGLSAMERTTGFHAAIVAEMIARGEVAAGAQKLESDVPAAAIVAAFKQRGVWLSESFS
ncbi:MAG: saccharopine dehydrogenase NADP-binding domain-containing protein [Candidatus Schekmanbacteria bacterium]|nr:saccharopine dehydrogenase NADP-binding domain-containing protein [Candidatus Schekmanbacteria bacterium]